MQFRAPVYFEKKRFGSTSFGQGERGICKIGGLVFRNHWKSTVGAGRQVLMKLQCGVAIVAGHGCPEPPILIMGDMGNFRLYTKCIMYKRVFSRSRSRGRERERRPTTVVVRRRSPSSTPPRQVSPSPKPRRRSISPPRSAESARTAQSSGVYRSVHRRFVFGFR